MSAKPSPEFGSKIDEKFLAHQNRAIRLRQTASTQQLANSYYLR
jgi:hypothetical protein